MPRKLVLIAVLTAALVVSGRAQQPSSLANLKTTAEASDFKSTSTYDDVVKFMKAVDDASPLVFYTTYGTTYEGRADADGRRRHRAEGREPGGRARHRQAARAHPGEHPRRRGRGQGVRADSAARARPWASTPTGCRSMVFLITPIFNADGNEKFALNNRGRQNGPINGQGTRAERPEPEHQPRLHEARDAGRARVREAVERLRPAGRLRPAHVGRIDARLLPDVRAAAQSGHERRDHDDHEGRVVPVRHEEHQGQARLGHVLLRQRLGGRAAAVAARGGGRGAAAPAGAAAGGAAQAARGAAAARCGARRGAGDGRGAPTPEVVGAPPHAGARCARGPRSSTCRATTTTTSACATASRC